MITNFSRVSFKRWDPDDYAEITGKTPNYSFYPKDSNGNIQTDYFDDSIKKHIDVIPPKESRSHANYALAKGKEVLSKLPEINPSQVAKKINLHA